jgi:hypothetical protein
MIELDLKGAGWAGRTLAAVACHSQWLSIRRGSGLAVRVSRIPVEASRVEASRVEPCG